jgi:uncharacterized lipoprotein YddW (UPF0748 family)
MKFLRILGLLLLIACTIYAVILIGKNSGNSGSSTVPTITPKPTGDDSGVATFPEPTDAAKKEMRGVWICTVWNNDWPSKSGLDINTQKQEFISLLDKSKSMGINTVMVQVRPMADALYTSSLYPWSQYLTGKQGKDPGYDPLKFMIEESSKRGLKLYTWFNPFRICTSDEGYKSLSSDSPALIHPGWVFKCNEGARWLNPGLPEVRQYVMDGIMEVVKNYDIDGVIFDDYFYPYPSYGSYDDSKAFSKYGKNFKSKGDWRRDNINTFISGLHKKIESAKPGIAFGISPFGIWKNKSQDPEGSDTNGMSSYDSIYADTRKWIKDGSVDFIAPQIYWAADFKIAPYKTLVNWWAKQVKGTDVKLYIAQAATRIGSDESPGWANIEEYPNQIKYNRSVPEVKGSIHFSISSLLDNRLSIRDILKDDLYKEPAEP